MRPAKLRNIWTIRPARGRLAAVLLVLSVGIALWGTQAPAVSADPPVISSDDFESDSFSGGSGWGDSWTVTNSVDIATDQAPHSGVRHLRMRGWSTLDRTINLSGSTELEIGFWAKAESLEGDDVVTAEVSNDGSAWTTLETWDGGVSDGQYRHYEYDLSGQGFSQQVFLRFRCSSDDAADYFFVDDLRLSGELVGFDDPPEGSTEIPSLPPPQSPSGASSIVIDGQFPDWDGYANLPDPKGDARRASGDMSALYWANNGGFEVNYWMVERYFSEGHSNYEQDDAEWHDWPGWGQYNSTSQARQVRYTIYIDTDDDGRFDERNDRRVEVHYQPRWGDSNVKVRVKHGKGGETIFSTSGDWGESIIEGGRRVELEVPWAHLGFSSGAVIRMYVKSDRNDRLPDGGDIQWSPASILGYWLLAAVMAIGGVVYWRIKRKREAACLSG